MSNRIGVSPDQRREDRNRRQREERRRMLIADVARQLGRDADSITDEDIEQYYRMQRERRQNERIERQFGDTVIDLEKFGAEEARRQALSPEERRREDVENAKRNLKDHLTPQFVFFSSGETHLDHYPILQLQTAPPSNNGATCQLVTCKRRIPPGDYRIAVTPGCRNGYGNPDYYHVHCLEELLDLTSPHFISRFEPDMIKYIPDRGAQCILEECTRKWKSQIQRANTEPNDWSIADDLRQEIRDASRQAVQRYHDRFNRIDAPREADASLSTPNRDWNITDYIPSESDPAYDGRHLLSRALRAWQNDLRLVFSEITELSDQDRIKREALGDSIQKIKDYAVVRMPNLIPFH